jgi:hypothetical protein
MSEPDKIDMERRNHPRFKVSHPVLYLTDVYPRPNVASTLDLSLGGTRIRIPYSLLTGERLEITLAIRPQVIKCRARTVHVAWVEQGRMEAGIEFEEISSHDKRCLMKHLSNLADSGVPVNDKKTLV